MAGRPVVLTTLEEKLRPDRAALVLVDMVNDFVHPEGKAAVRANRSLDAISPIIPRMQALLESARSAGCGVFHVQHTTLPDHASDSGPWLDARSRATYSVEDICMEGTWGQRFLEELTPAATEPVVKKHRYSGFAGTNLEMLLRGARRETVVVCGASTNVCVESTARDAFSRDFYVVWPEDASGSWSADLHRSALESAGHRYATVCSTDDVLAVWNA